MNPISAAELKARIDRDEDLLLVNTLDEQYFDQTRIPGAINVPQTSKDFEACVLQHAGRRDRTVVVYCANQKCPSSTQGAEKLSRSGFTNVFDFEGGAEAWRELPNTVATH